MITWIKNNSRRLLLKIAVFQKNHWVISIAFIKLSAIWYSLVLTYYGKQLNLITETNGVKELTTLGIICTIIIFFIVLITEYANKVDNDINWIETHSGFSLLMQNLLNSTVDICNNKLDTLISEIVDIKQKKKAPLPKIITNPSQQLNVIAHALSLNLQRLLDDEKGGKWSTDSMYISIAYEYPDDQPGVWHWATNERGLSLNDLLNPTSQNTSTMKHCLQKKGNCVFYNCKNKAYEKGFYIPDNLDIYDSNDKILGSIACYKGDIKKNDTTFIRFIINITTYGAQFVSTKGFYENEDSEAEAEKKIEDAINAVRYNITTHIIPNFMIRIKVELCLLYLSQLKSLMAETKH